MISNSLLNAALLYHAMGRRVIPTNKDKSPACLKYKHWFTMPQTEDEVRDLFSGSVYGLARLLYPASDDVVLDFDGAHFQEAWDRYGCALPETSRIMSPHGVHYYFRSPQELDIKRTIRLVKADCSCKGPEGQPKPCGVDLLLKGYIIAPPTRGYKEDPDAPIESAVMIPEAVLEMARAASRNEKGKSEKKDDTGGDRIVHGQRNSTLTSLAGTMRRRGMTEEEILAALRIVNQQRCDPPLPDEEVRNIAHSVVGYELGATTEEHLTDLGNARRLVARHGLDLRYCYQWGKWLVWDETKWAKDETGEIYRRAKKTIAHIYLEVAAASDDDNHKGLAKHALKSEAETRINAMVGLAQSELGIPVTPDQLDTNPWLLNVVNGTLDLRTGKLCPHDRENRLTKIAPVEYDPDATCPTWQGFLDHIMAGSENLINFLQRAIGYALTGDVSEQVLFLLYGTGANGKSTFLNAIRKALGDYAKQAAPDLLITKKGESHPTELADIAGCRFLTSIEVEEGKRLAEALVKQLTGGDPIKGRFMKKDFFEFMPMHKIFMAINHKPTIRGTDGAIWRRIRLVPFKVTIPEEEWDKNLPEKLKAELPGILLWAVQGCLAWQREGLGNPDEIKNATSEYQAEMDVLADFLDECCVLKPTAWVPVGELYKKYKDWCESNGEYPQSQRSLSPRIKERGFENKRGTGGRWQWIGLGLKEDEPVDP